jgi:RNA polymerase sigma-70 factor, ECF subfamily
MRGASMTSELLAKARAGDGAAFGQLVDPHRRELQVHCYRILGSLQDAEDALQETLVAAWRAIGGFEGRASVRTWLYQIATRRCLNELRSARRHRRTDPPALGLDLPEPTRLGEVTWLQPYPDDLLNELATDVADPEARYETAEAISLAFMTAVQLLPPRQRAVLVLRDVLGFPAREVATMLDSSEQSVTSALTRARAHLRRELPDPTGPEQPGSTSERKLVTEFTRALHDGDVDALVALLTRDVVLAMPPLPLQYVGRDLAARFHAAVTFREGRTYLSIPTRANGQPAFALYFPDSRTGVHHANGLMVLTVSRGRISAMTRFENNVLPLFGLLDTLPARAARPSTPTGS